MIKLLRKIGHYITAALTGKFDEVADPKVQLEQAIQEAQDQHRRLKEQAANVIANQKQTEMRLNRAMDELQKVNSSPRQAVMMADEAVKSGDTAKSAEYEKAAEAFAGRLIGIEKEVESLKSLSLQSTQAADQGQGRSQLQRLGAAEEAERAPEAPQPARPGEDAGADEQGDGLADRRPSARTSPRSKRCETRSSSATRVRSAPSELQGQTGRVAHARGRAGVDGHRGAGPPRRRSARSSGSATAAPERTESPRPATTEGTAELLATGSTTRSSRWTTSWGDIGGRSAVCRPAPLLDDARTSGATRPLANTRPSVSGDLDGVARRRTPRRTSTTPAGSSDVPRSMSARRAPSSTTTCRTRRRRTRSRACGPAAAGRAAARRCRRPARPATAAASTPGRSAAAITARTPDHAAIRAAASFDAMPPLPRSDAGPPAAASSAWSTSTISSMSDASVVEPRVGGEHAGGVGEQHEQVGVDEVGDERGEPVVVAEADLVVGHRVVLVDDRHDAELEQPHQRLPGVQVLLAVDEVERRQQHLAADQAVARRACRRSTRMSRLWPTAATACSVARSVGRGPCKPRAGRPAAIAPDVTMTTRSPSAAQAPPPRRTACSIAAASIVTVRRR